jgi:hypothetical protein
MEYIENIEEHEEHEEHEGQKKCSKCGEWKDLSEFYKDKKGKYGLRCCCKQCISKINKQYKLDNYEQIQRYKDENKEILNAERRQYYLNNKERIKEINKKWRQNNLESSRTSNKKCRLNNPLRYLLQSCISRAKKRNLNYDNINLLQEYFQSIYDKGECEICHYKLEHNIGNGYGYAKDNSPSIDQIIPKNGYIIGNVALICNKCNRIKSNGTIEDHRNIANWMEQKIHEINKVS